MSDPTDPRLLEMYRAVINEETRIGFTWGFTSMGVSLGIEVFTLVGKSWKRVGIPIFADVDSTRAGALLMFATWIAQLQEAGVT